MARHLILVSILGLLITISWPGEASEPPSDTPACLLEQFSKMSNPCQAELGKLVEQNRTLKTERDAIAEELQQVREKTEKGEPAPDEAEALAPGSHSEHGYGGALWGMAAAEVIKAVPGLKSGRDKTQLIVSKTVAENPAMVSFGFEHDRLASAEVAFAKSSFNKVEGLIEEYTRLKDLLTDKYAEPVSDQTDLKAGGRNAVASRRKPPSAGQIELTTTWETAQTEIVLSCQGRLSAVQMKVDYRSKEVARAERERQLKDL